MNWEDKFLSRTGVKVSPLAFGTMTFGDAADESTSEALFNMALDAGINVFDCANVYAKGKSEEILGRLIKPIREEVLITTKAYFPTSEGRNARGLSRLHLFQSVDSSLRRLDTDYIDIFFLHRFDENTDMTDTLAAVNNLIERGKIHYFALSNFSAWQAMKAVGICEARGWSRPVALQPMYNLVKRQAEVEILPMAHAEKLAVFSYSPLGGGLLTGKYSDPGASGRISSNQMYKIRYGENSYHQTANSFSALAKSWGLSPAALAIAWCAFNPAITAPIIGARNTEQLDSCLKALKIELTAEQYQQISELSPTPPPATDRNEETSAHSYSATLKKS